MSPLPSPLLMPQSPRNAVGNLATPNNHYKSRVPNINTGFAADSSARDNSTQSPTRLLPSTSTISLLSLSFSKANMEEENVSMDSVLEEPQQQPPLYQSSQSPIQPVRRKNGHLTPSGSFTSAGQYLNSAQHRRVSHYMSGVAGSPTSVSRRSSAVALSSTAGAGPQSIPVQPKSRRQSYSLQSPGQSPMHAHMMIPPDSPSLGPVSLVGSPSKMYLAQTPPVGHFTKWMANNSASGGSGNYVPPGTNTNADDRTDDETKVNSDTVSTTAAALAAALESEINHHNKVSPITIPIRHEDPGSPGLDPTMSPLETTPMTPMALDIQSQQNSLQNQSYLAHLHKLQSRQQAAAATHMPEGPESIMEVLNG